jgi:hypothetical protein
MYVYMIMENNIVGLLQGLHATVVSYVRHCKSLLSRYFNYIIEKKAYIML